MKEISPICPIDNLPFKSTNSSGNGRLFIECDKCGTNLFIRNFICSYCYNPFYITLFQSSVIAFCSNPECRLYRIVRDRINKEKYELTKTIWIEYIDVTIIKLSANDNGIFDIIENTFAIKMPEEFRSNLINNLSKRYNFKVNYERNNN